jgi:hypothetical protein
MTQRDYQLSFCRYCVNQTFDYHQGLICSLTNAKADFDTECDWFKLDNTAVQEARTKLKASHPTNLQNTFSLSRKLGLPVEPIEVRKSRFKYLAPMLLIIVIVSIFPIIEILSNPSSAEQKKLWMIPFLFIDTVALWIFFGRDYLKKEIVLRLSQNGVEANGELTPWSNYVGFLYQKEVEGFGLRKTTHHTIVLKFIGRKDLEIDISTLSLSRQRLMNSIEKFEKNFAQRI